MVKGPVRRGGPKGHIGRKSGDVYDTTVVYIRVVIIYVIIQLDSSKKFNESHNKRNKRKIGFIQLNRKVNKYINYNKTDFLFPKWRSSVLDWDGNRGGTEGINVNRHKSKNYIVKYLNSPLLNPYKVTFRRLYVLLNQFTHFLILVQSLRYRIHPEFTSIIRMN